jgi:glycosyltransferase involved in cell wall biosynthesis
MSVSVERPIRVLVASDSIPERNGVGAYYVDLIAQLRDRGCRATLVCPDPERDRWHLPLPGDSTQRIYWPVRGRFPESVRRLDPDVFVVATPGPYGVAGARWARRLKRPLLVGFHTHYAGVTDLYPHTALRVLSRAYFRSIDRMLFRNAVQVLGNSDEMLALAGRLGAPGLERIGTLLPQAVLETSPRPPSGRIQRILFAGRLAPEKRLDHVLATARELPAMEFAIAGDGPLKPDVIRAARKHANIRYLGWLSRQQLIDQMDACDALVLPSTVESFGNVALEAMARGRIAVVTDTCGIVNWNGLAPHLVTFPLSSSLADVLGRLRSEPEADLIARSQASHRAALALNAASLEQWLGILHRHADS